MWAVPAHANPRDSDLWTDIWAHLLETSFTHQGGALQVVKMGGVLGAVFQAPRTASKSARLIVDVKGLNVELKLSEVMWTVEQQQPVQHSVQQARQRNRKETQQRHRAEPQTRIRGASQPQQGMFAIPQITCI